MAPINRLLHWIWWFHLGSVSVVVTAYSESGHPGSNPEWGLIYYEASITAQCLPEPSSPWGSTFGTRAAEHKGCNWGMQVDFAVFSTVSVVSADISHRNKVNSIAWLFRRAQPKDSILYIYTFTFNLSIGVTIHIPPFPPLSSPLFVCRVFAFPVIPGIRIFLSLSSVLDLSCIRIYWRLVIGLYLDLCRILFAFFDPPFSCLSSSLCHFTIIISSIQRSARAGRPAGRAEKKK